jgi:zinc protease
VAGDIDPSAALALIDAYFGSISPGPASQAAAPPASLVRPVRLLQEDRVELPRVYMAWHSPAMFAAGDAELDLLGDALANGKTSRLYQALVYTRRMATEVAAFQNSRELGSFFQVIATAAPGHTLAELETVIDEEIDRLVTEGPTDEEMERSLAQAEAQFVYRLQTVGGFGGKSDQLNAYNVFVGEPGFFDRDLERYRSATREGLRTAAARYLRDEPRVTLSVVPHGRVDLSAPFDERAVVQ